MLEEFKKLFSEQDLARCLDHGENISMLFNIVVVVILLLTPLSCALSRGHHAPSNVSRGTHPCPGWASGGPAEGGENWRQEAPRSQHPEAAGFAPGLARASLNRQDQRDSGPGFPQGGPCMETLPTRPLKGQLARPLWELRHLADGGRSPQRGQ